MQSLGFIYPLCLAEQSCASRDVMGFFISLYILFTSFHCCKVLTDFNGRLTGKDPCHITYLFPPKGPARWDESRSPLVPREELCGGAPTCRHTDRGGKAESHLLCLLTWVLHQIQLRWIWQTASVCNSRYHRNTLPKNNFLFICAVFIEC